MINWIKWDGRTDLKRLVLVKTVSGMIIVAQQRCYDAERWNIYIPKTPMLFQPELEDRVEYYMDLSVLRDFDEIEMN